MEEKKTKSEDAPIDEELIAKGRDAIKDFDESQEIQVSPKKKESKLISIRIPLSMMKKLKALALSKGGKGYQQIIKEFIREGLVKEDKIEARLEKENSVVEELQSTGSSVYVDYWQENIQFNPHPKEEAIGGIYISEVEK